MLASWRNHTDIVQLLLDKGADINSQNLQVRVLFFLLLTTKGQSALLGAAIKGHIETVAKLLENGADVDLTNEGVCKQKYQ